MAKKATTNSSTSPSFDEFWRAYPLHKARKQAEQAWQRLTASDRRAAIAALPAYRLDCEQNGIQFKYAQGWLNGRRWEDELTATKPELFAQPLPSHPRGKATGRRPQVGNGAGVGSETSPTPPDGMEKW